MTAPLRQPGEGIPPHLPLASGLTLALASAGAPLCGSASVRATQCRLVDRWWSGRVLEGPVGSDEQWDRGAGMARLFDNGSNYLAYQRPQQDSNLRTRLRRPLLYPLSYGGWR